MSEIENKNLKLLRKPQVLEKIGVSAATLWRMCKVGMFPKPIKVGINSVAWIEQEIDDWIADKVSERDRSAGV